MGTAIADYGYNCRGSSFFRIDRVGYTSRVFSPSLDDTSDA